MRPTTYVLGRGRSMNPPSKTACAGRVGQKNVVEQAMCWVGEGGLDEHIRELCAGQGDREGD
jgi:hypothetical protein